jgi:hypothetical protein
MADIQSELVQMLKDGQAELNKKLKERMDAGAEEYGDLAFLNRETIDEVMEEVADVINWGTFVYLKMYMVKRAYNALLERRDNEGDATGFIPMQDLFGKPMR